MIENEIEILIAKTHKLSLMDSRRRLSENNKSLMTAECIKMQELVKSAIDRELQYEDTSVLYKSDVGVFVENFN